MHIQNIFFGKKTSPEDIETLFSGLSYPHSQNLITLSLQPDKLNPCTALSALPVMNPQHQAQPDNHIPKYVFL